ncbi:MAG: hypothetical protein C0402_06715 [Thermodesulfovibrio sp.]|nr:hypothetical protein [Thermodesulfovibrio sp.]
MKVGGHIKALLENTLKMLTGTVSGAPGSGNALRQRVLALTFLVIIASGICWLNYRLHFNGFVLNDYHEYCQIARNFYEGNGYSTSVLRPIAYQFFQTLPQPEVTRMPIYPFFLSLFFHLFGPSDNTIVLFNSICYIGLLVSIFFVSLELSGDYRIGILVALLTASMKSFLEYTLTAEPNLFYAALFTLLLYFFLKYPDKTFLLGMFLGILYQVRANSLFVLFGFIAAALIGKTRWLNKLGKAFFLIAGFAAGLIPYMIRNYMVIGKPFFSLYQYSLLLFTEGFPSYSIWTQLSNVDPKAYVLSHPGEIAKKAYTFFALLLDNAMTFYNPLVLLIIGIGFFLTAEDLRVRSLRSIIIAGILLQIAMLLPIGSVPYYYMYFFPAMIAAGAMNIRRYIGQYTPFALLGILLFFVYISIPYWKNPKPVNTFIPIGVEVSSLTGPQDIILSDIPWETTWYANRRSIWLPYDLDTFKTISRTLKPNYILLTGRLYLNYKDDIWRRMAEEPGYAENMGYTLNKIITYQHQPVALLFKTLDRRRS